MFRPTKKRTQKQRERNRAARELVLEEQREQAVVAQGEATLSEFEKTMLQTNLFQYLQKFIEFDDLVRFGKVSKRSRQLVAENLFRHPDQLLQRLSTRGQKQLGLFIQSHGHQLGPVAVMVGEDQNKHGAYAFYALMVHDIHALDDKRLQAALRFLQEKQFPQDAIDSLQFIIDFKRRGKEGLLQLLAPQHMLISQKASYFYMNLAGADLSGTELTAKNFRGCNLAMTNLQDSQLIFSHFSSANMMGANLMQANLSAANLHGAIMRGCNCVKANLGSADLIEVDARDALFCNANLNMADLTKANVLGADFSYADLTCARVCGVDFRGTNLTGVNLSSADITNAKFVGAQFFANKALNPEKLETLLDGYNRKIPKSLHKVICTNLIRTIYENQGRLTAKETEEIFNIALGSQIFFKSKFQNMLREARSALLSPDLKQRQSLAEQADLLEEQMNSSFRRGKKK